MRTAKSKLLQLHYRFTLRKGDPLEFPLKLYYPSLKLLQEPPKERPDWTRLEFCQCPHCPLRAKEHPRCPVALGLVDVVSRFATRLSFEEAEVTLETQARRYTQTLPLQHGISSLMGIIMVTAGCPIMDKLRPMVLTHLPFATPEETTYRAISMYLLAQFFVHRRGGRADWELRHLVTLYEDVSQVNRSFTKRLKDASQRDASLNALFNLDCFANFTVLSITESGLADFEEMFRPYLLEPGRAKT